MGAVFFLSPVELTDLVTLVGARSMVGVPDCFSGWLAEEVVPVLEATQQELVSRGLVTVEQGVPRVAHPALRALLYTCGFPERVAVLQSGGRTACFYCRPELIAELQQGEERFLLTGHVDPAAAVERALSAVPPAGDGPEAAHWQGRLPLSVLWRAGELAGSDPEGAAALLGGSGVSPTDAIGLAEALGRPETGLSIAVLTHDDLQWSVHRLSLACSRSGASWLFSAQPASALADVRACGLGAAREAVAAFLSAHLAVAKAPHGSLEEVG